MKRQGVELYRFMMTLIVCLHHFRLYSPTVLPYGGGYLAVDFFFILSGYFLYIHSKKIMNSYTVKTLERTVEYAIQRYKRLFPQYVLVLFLSTVVYVCAFQVDIDVTRTIDILAKVFMFDGIYVHPQSSIMPQGWYCSVLWIDSIFIYFLCIRYRHKFVKKVAVILAVGIYATLLWRYGHLNLYTQFGLGITVGVFRGGAGLCLGCALGNLEGKERIQRKNLIWIDVIVFLVSTSIMLYALLWNKAHNKSDFLILLVFVVLLYYLTSDNIISHFFNKFDLNGLGGISYNIFLVHHVIAVLFDQFDWLRAYDWKIVSVAYLGGVVICSVLLDKITVAGIVVMNRVGSRNRL